jgi:3-phosphoshikimate 1-carboxyvinyltransferase
VALEDPRSEGGEPVADWVIRPARLVGTEVGADEVPAAIDEIPILAALAARAEGETRISGAGELRVKETDRIAALVSNLRAVGAEAEELPDGLVIRGTDRPLCGTVRAYGDHRIAMAFGVLGALPGNEIEIDDRDVAAVSFPAFWETLRSLTGR